MKKLLSKIVQYIIIGICIFLFGWLIRWGLENQLYTTANENTIVFPEGKSKDDSWEGLWVVAEIISIDQLNSNLAIQLDFDVSQNLLDERGRLAEDLTLTILDQGEYLHRKGELVHRQIINLSMHGAPIDYPLDKYITNLDLTLNSVETENGKKNYYPVRNYQAMKIK